MVNPHRCRQTGSDLANGLSLGSCTLPDPMMVIVGVSMAIGAKACHCGRKMAHRPIVLLQPRFDG